MGPSIDAKAKQAPGPLSHPLVWTQCPRSWNRRSLSWRDWRHRIHTGDVRDRWGQKQPLTPRGHAPRPPCGRCVLRCLHSGIGRSSDLMASAPLPVHPAKARAEQTCVAELQENGALTRTCRALAGAAFRLLWTGRRGAVLSLAGDNRSAWSELPWPQVHRRSFIAVRCARLLLSDASLGAAGRPGWLRPAVVLVRRKSLGVVTRPAQDYEEDMRIVQASVSIQRVWRGVLGRGRARWLRIEREGRRLLGRLHVRAEAKRESHRVMEGVLQVIGAK